jgi:hypothetical protein
VPLRVCTLAFTSSPGPPPLFLPPARPLLPPSSHIPLPALSHPALPLCTHQMYDALIKKVGSLPDATLVYCGHEYTTSNLRWAHHVEPDNEHVVAKAAWAHRCV